MRTKEQMFEDIRNWEMDAGEDFCDYFGSYVNEFNLLFWAWGKGYITEEQLQAYEKNRHASLSDIVYGDETYSIVKESEYAEYDEGYEKAYKILAEFLTSTNTYQERVEEFISRIDKIKLEDVLRELIRRERIFIKYQGKDIYVNPDEILQVPVGKILSTQWYRNNNELEDEE